jgi:hypothetical protein
MGQESILKKRIREVSHVGVEEMLLVNVFRKERIVVTLR